MEGNVVKIFRIIRISVTVHQSSLAITVITVSKSLQFWSIKQTWTDRWNLLRTSHLEALIRLALVLSNVGSQKLIYTTINRCRRVTAAPSLQLRLKSHLFSLSYRAFWLFSYLYSARI